MVQVVARTFRLAAVCAQVQEPVVKKPEGPVVGVAESPAGFGHLFENRLEPGSTSDSAKDAADGALCPRTSSSSRARFGSAPAAPAVRSA